MKLYEKEKDPLIKVSNEEYTFDLGNQIEKDIVSLESYLKAFNSLTIIENHIATENFNFVDKGNYVLYNEYINTVTSNLGIKNIPIVSQESISTLSDTALNHHIALEGFIGDMWKKIKEIFSKIYNSIKEFFNTYFTKLGRVKNKLKNLSEVLSETNKDIQKVNLDNVPSNMSSKLPYGNNINSNILIEVLNNTKLLVQSLDEINKKANIFISKDILDKDFIANINKLKEEVNNTNNQISQNEKDKKPGTVFSEAKFGEDGKINNEINETNKSLAADAKSKSQQIDDAENKVKSITDKENNLSLPETKADEAKKEFESFIESLVYALNKVKGKKLIKGKIIVNVTGDGENGLNLETDESKDTPSTITLDDKDTLLKIIKETVSMLESAEKLTETYGKINDVVMENMNKVDKLILDIDKMGDEKLGKYKKLLNNKIKVKLNLVKTFFNNYNKVSKNIFEMALDCGEAVVDYTVLSLKHFG